MRTVATAGLLSHFVYECHRLLTNLLRCQTAVDFFRAMVDSTIISKGREIYHEINHRHGW
jgi:hypothetical protein